MDHKIVKNIVEAALFAAGRPMSMNELLRLFSEDERPERKAMGEIVRKLQEEYSERGIELIEVASGFRVQVQHQMSEWLGRLSERRPPRYSRALMETLALVAYRQPITRGEIEDVRGVSVSTNIVRSLLERGWVRIVGHRDVPGRPAMFGTTKEFLDYFNLKSLDELPSLAELTDVDKLNAELDFGEPPYDDLQDEDSAEESVVTDEDLEAEFGTDALEQVRDDADELDDDGEESTETVAEDKYDDDNDNEEERASSDEHEDDDERATADDDDDFDGWDVEDEDDDADADHDDQRESLSA